jgi:hypothetical protein
MTEQLPRARLAPQFVSRRTAEKLLDLSKSGFGNWVKRGLLPPPCPGAPAHEARWEWAEIVAWMRGDRSSAPRNLFGEPPRADMGKRPGPEPGHGGRPRSQKERTDDGEANGT